MPFLYQAKFYDLRLLLIPNLRIMHRRDFTKSVLAAGSGMALGTIPLSSCQTVSNQKKALPKNWIWIRPDLSWTEDQWKEQFAVLKQTGIDAILPQIWNSHHTLFDHPFLPVKERWLEKIIPLAHANALEVHAWMWSMPMNVPEMIEKHPDWFSFNRNGDPSHTHPAYVDYYKFLCPCHPEVQEYLATIVETLGKIEDLDGIHLDYIRQPDVILAEALQPKYDIVQDKEYPEYDYPYSQNCRNAFKEEHGIDPMDLGDDAPSHAAWRQFRYDAISSIVNDFAVPKARKYQKTITAAVFPNWESVRQQWQRWDLDAFLPMLYHKFYNKDIDWIGEHVEINRQLVPQGKEIYAGLFLEHLQPNEIARACAIAREKGAKGISFFAMSNFNPEFQKAFKKIHAL